jgi:hypothetical protein
MSKSKIQVDMNGSYKLGMHEVVGLREAMAKAFEPVRALVQERVYWSEVEFKDAEYKSRDGFIPNKDNCGGVMIDLVIPKCEESSFSFLEFGECDGCNEDCSVCMATLPDSSGECMSESENHLDARLRIWFKFEGINDDGNLEFYINACGGNGDAPYFRIGNLADVFEAQFTAKSVAGIQRAASKHIKALIKALE